MITDHGNEFAGAFRGNGYRGVTTTVADGWTWPSAWAGAEAVRIAVAATLVRRTADANSGEAASIAAPLAGRGYDDRMPNLSTIALALPDIEQGVACPGTTLESRTYMTRKKAFLFVSKKQARLKLDSSAAEAKKLGFAVGANGWVTLPLDALPTASVAKRWVKESHALASGPAGKRTEAKATAVRKGKR